MLLTNCSESPSTCRPAPLHWLDSIVEMHLSSSTSSSSTRRVERDTNYTEELQDGIPLFPEDIVSLYGTSFLFHARSWQGGALLTQESNQIYFCSSWCYSSRLPAEGGNAQALQQNLGAASPRCEVLTVPPTPAAATCAVLRWKSGKRVWLENRKSRWRFLRGFKAVYEYEPSARV